MKSPTFLGLHYLLVFVCLFVHGNAFPVLMKTIRKQSSKALAFIGTKGGETDEEAVNRLCTPTVWSKLFEITHSCPELVTYTTQENRFRNFI